MMKEILEECNVCPHRCKVNRKNGQLGVCKTNANVKVALASVHAYEEPCISRIKWFRNYIFF